MFLFPVPWTPIVAHANEAYEKRHHPNLHFVFYENMKKVFIFIMINYYFFNELLDRTRLSVKRKLYKYLSFSLLGQVILPRYINSVLV